MLPITLWTFISTVASVRALSSSSPPDLLASPKSNLHLSRNIVSNDSATALLAGPQPYKLMRSSSGQAFLCLLPDQANTALAQTSPTKQQHDELAGLTRAERRKKSEDKIQAGLQKGLTLLEPLKQGCLYMKQGWFTYSFCHGSTIRQFHEIKVINQQGHQSNAPVEDPSTKSYTLGSYPSADKAPASLNAAGDGIDLRELLSSSSTDLDLNFGRTTGEDAHHLSQDAFSNAKRYLVQQWGDGTVCDMTGIPRRVEVQYHCNTQSTDRIALIRETAICQYLLVVHTPRLCSEPLFLASGDSNASEAIQSITCDPIGNPYDGREEIAAAPEPAVAETPEPVVEEPTIFEHEQEAPSLDEPIEEVILYFDEQGNIITPETGEVGHGDFSKQLAAMLEKSLGELFRGETEQQEAQRQEPVQNNKRLNEIVQAYMHKKGDKAQPVKQKKPPPYQKGAWQPTPNVDRPYIGSSVQNNLRGIYGDKFGGKQAASDQEGEKQDKRKRDEL